MIKRVNDLSQSHYQPLAFQDESQGNVAASLGFRHTFPVQSPGDGHHSMHMMKIELFCFNGSKLNTWIFKANEFFDFYNTLENQRTKIASFYLEGSAPTWYQWSKQKCHNLLGEVFFNYCRQDLVFLIIKIFIVIFQN